jgi:gamma-glutamyltranspeptidase/glutathione hydrolase
MPEPGDPWPFQQRAGLARASARPRPAPGLPGGGTSYLCVIDAHGNGFSATPSDPLNWAPVVPGLGLVMSPRGVQSRLDPSHPSALAPGKRPRLTPNPALALRDGELWMVFGTPGGDMQVQAMLQTFLNVVEFGMDTQQAVEQPRFGTFSYPDSFYPHAYHPGLLRVERRIPARARQALADRGHAVEAWADLEPEAGGVCAITRASGSQTLAGGADPRRACYALGW